MGFFELMATADQAVRSHLGGVLVTYQPQVGDAVVVTGLFDENYVLVEAGQNGVEQVGPAVSLRLDELPVDPEQDEPTLTISGRLYRVRERKPDSIRGLVVLLLHRADL